MQDGDPATAVLAAEGWHRTGGGVPAALEALIAAEQASDAEAEVRARVALSSSLQGQASQLMAASASLVALVSNQPVPPLPKAREPEIATTLALAEAELAAPGDDPRRREVALRGLADVLEGSSSTLHEMAAWSALARGDHASARALFARALELAQLAGEEPRSALEGAIDTELLASGGQASRNWAELVERLARHVEKRGDRDGAAGLWEQVGHQWWDKLGDPARGEAALDEAFARDNKRKAAFDRVFRAVRSRKEDDRLLALVGRRLETTDDPPEMAKLFWEQARVLRAKGDRDAALASLENVTMLEPDHVGALALSAEIYVGRQMYAEAAAALDRLSRQPVPAQQKLGAGIGAADLYESKLEAHDKALDVLVSLDKAGLSDVAIHERIARAAARAEAWVPATTYLEKLVKERRDSKGRVEAARLAAAIYRDKLDDPHAAVPSLVALLREAPDDAEAIEHLLDAGPNPAAVRDTLVASRAAARAILAQNPADPRYARIVAQTSGFLGENDLQQIALCLLVALQQASGEEERAAATLVSRLGTAPAVALDRDSARRLAAAEELGPVLDLFRVMGPTIAEALGPTTEALGVGRRERVDARAGNALRNEVAAWAGAIGIAEFEFYQGGKDPNLIQGVPAETPAIVVGANIRAPLSLVDRARLVRELVALERGTTVTLLRDDVAVAAVIVASCAIAEVPLQTPAYAVLAETQRLLSKAISRKTKKLLPDVANAVARQLGGGGDLRTFRGHALRTLDRAAAIAAGDPAAALVGIVGPNAVPAKISADVRAAAMLRFVWSDDYLALRRQLGLGIG
jgi:tetratricopeptide (TPR) repeat protein